MLEDDLNKLHQDIDELNHLIEESVGLSKEPVNNRQLRLTEMLLRLQDGDLEDRHIHRLQRWLESDPSSLQYYIDFMHFDSLLYLYYHPEIFQRSLEMILPESPGT